MRANLSACILALGALAAPVEAAGPGAAAPDVAVLAPQGVLPVSFRFLTREEGHEILVNDVHVAIDDAATHGRVLAAVSDGPYLSANVPAGCYRVTATHDGRAQVAEIVVGRGAPLVVAFYW